MSTDADSLKPKERILIAARELFMANGYAQTSVRKIAALANTDPALVLRHYGSKELLFMDVMILDDSLVSASLDLERGCIGQRIVSHILMIEADLQHVYVALMQASGSQLVTDRMNTVLKTLFEIPVLGLIDTPDKEIRASFIVSMMMGLMDSLWILRDERLLSLDVERAVEIYGSAIQHVVDADFS